MAKPAENDPFRALKNIAYYRTELPNNDDVGFAELIDHAKWKICKTRNILWHDPVWTEYTDEEILVEFFSITFDENPQAREDFGKSILKPKARDLEWFDEMERKILKENAEKVKASAPLTETPLPDKIIIGEEFDDTFPG